MCDGSFGQHSVHLTCTTRTTRKTWKNKSCNGWLYRPLPFLPLSLSILCMLHTFMAIIRKFNINLYTQSPLLENVNYLSLAILLCLSGFLYPTFLRPNLQWEKINPLPILRALWFKFNVQLIYEIFSLHRALSCTRWPHRYTHTAEYCHRKGCENANQGWWNYLKIHNNTNVVNLAVSYFAHTLSVLTVEESNFKMQSYPAGHFVSLY